MGPIAFIKIKLPHLSISICNYKYCHPKPKLTLYLPFIQRMILFCSNSTEKINIKFLSLELVLLAFPAQDGRSANIL
jgi:hypothetical protein